MRMRGPWWGIVILAIAMITAIRIFTPPQVAPQDKAIEAESARVSTKAAESTFSEGGLVALSAARMIEADWSDLLHWLDSDPKPSEAEIRARLLALRGKWAEMDPILLAETIGNLLESGRDATTGMKFLVGLHGFLDGWPTLRVFLLDALVVADSETAAAIARRVLDQTKSADEFAIAMRSLTRDRSANAGNGELLERFSHALKMPGWQTSGAFAESLDLARTIGTGSAAGQLLRWDGNPALKSMALHEFAADHPAEILQALQSESAVDPVTRANLMARLDPAVPLQLAAIDQYLRDPLRTQEDAAVFLKSFPLRSATTGNRLYAPSPSPYQLEQITTGDQAALSLVAGWISDPTLESIRPDLLALRQRLSEWVEQGK